MPFERMIRTSFVASFVLFGGGMPGLATIVYAQDSYARYTPSQCMQAVRRTERVTLRAARLDTMPYIPETQQWSPAAIQTARACVARFRADTVAPRELFELGLLSIAAGNDSVATVAFRRLLATNLIAARTAGATASPAEQGRMAFMIVSELLEAKPVRLADARIYLARLDSIGVPAATWSARAHLEIAKYALSRHDVETAVTHARAATQMVTRARLVDQLDNSELLGTAFTTLATAVALQSGVAATTKILDAGQNTVVAIRPQGSSWGRDALGNIERQRELFFLYGTPASRVEGAHWFYNSKRGLTASDTVTPTPGRTTIVVAISTGSFQEFSVYRRLYAKYGAAGLRIVFLQSTKGYFRLSPPLQPADEASLIGRYYVEHLDLPVVVAIEETLYGRKRDGRRINEPNRNPRAYPVDAAAVLVDGEGRIRYIGDLGVEQEATWNALLAHLLESRH